jgi:peptidylprolyl isomerase
MHIKNILSSGLNRLFHKRQAYKIVGLLGLSLSVLSFYGHAYHAPFLDQESNIDVDTKPALPTHETLAQDNLVYLYTDEGLVIIELAAFIAPKHVKQFTALVQEGFYDGLDFYRVIDGFVAQGGDLSEKKASAHKSALKAEFSRSRSPNSDFYRAQSPDLYADQTGFIKGFPAGRDRESNTEWLLHCPGAVAMARTNDIDSGTTDFYIVIGQAPRQLDRNMSVFGQVVFGMQHVQAFSRGEREAGGVIEEAAKRSKIISAKLGNKVPIDEQITLTRPTVEGAIFQQRLDGGRTLNNDFFHYKGNGNIDVCYYRPITSIESN